MSSQSPLSEKVPLVTTKSDQIWPTTYSPPTKGILSFFPRSWVPYLELIRLDKRPGGELYLYAPCLAASLLAGSTMDPIAAPSHVSRINLIFFLGCFMFDCMACTWDDVLDQDIDRKQARTKFRPLARRAVSTTNAVLYTGFQLVLGAALLTQFPPQCLYYAIPSVFLIGLYPLSKRVINYPQVFLGVTWAYGGVMGFAAMGVDLFNSPAAMKTSLCLYFSGICWTVIYDTVYAHQDLEDDLRDGVKSTAVTFRAAPKTYLSGLAIIQISLLSTAGFFAEANYPYFAGIAAAASTHLWMLTTLDLKDSRACWWWFQNSCWVTGGCIAGGCFGEYVYRLAQENLLGWW